MRTERQGIVYESHGSIVSYYTRSAYHSTAASRLRRARHTASNANPDGSRNRHSRTSYPDYNAGEPDSNPH